MDLIYNKRKQNKQTFLNKNTMPMLLFFATIFGLASCQSLEKKAAKEAKDYTERCCPTPVINNTRTDSLTFDESTLTFTYYMSFLDQLDNSEAIAAQSKGLSTGLHEMILNDTSKKVYLDKGFKFAYVIRSGSNPKQILFKDTVKK